jgi:hypothetical protein
MIPLPAIHVVTAPVEARVRSLAAPDTLVGPGDVVAVLDDPRGPRPLRSTVHGHVGGALAGAGQPVVPGEGVVWLRR